MVNAGVAEMKPTSIALPVALTDKTRFTGPEPSSQRPGVPPLFHAVLQNRDS
jgi:hypothetical protein